MNNITYEAIGHAYPAADMQSVHNQAEAFVTSLLRKHHWWAENSNDVVQSEGGMASLTLNAVCEALMAPSVKEGLKAYGAFLVKTYGATTSENKNISLEREYEDTIGSTEGRDDLSFGGSPSDALLEHLNVGIRRKVYLTDQQRDFLDTLAHLGQLQAGKGGTVQEAARMSGLSQGQAKYLLRKLRLLARTQ